MKLFFEAPYFIPQPVEIRCGDVAGAARETIAQRRLLVVVEMETEF